MPAKNQAHAHARDVSISDIYHAQLRPGYACWVSLWREPDGTLRLAFVEKRRAPNPTYRAIPIDFWESMGLPIKYQISFCNGSPDIRTESVVMQSDDEGETWREVGRSDLGGLMNVFAYASGSDGTLLRGIDTSYLSFTSEEIPRTLIQRSKDNGNTWSTAAVLTEKDFFGYPYRMRRLSDGTLVCLCPFSASFGPERQRPQRHTTRPDVIMEMQCGIWASADDGTSWSGPTIVLPGILGWEPDVVELPSGDLLVLNSSVQDGQPVRQYLRRTDRGFLPGPVYRVSSGIVPETVCVTKTGILVGAVRGGPYTCSNDDGATWHVIGGLPDCEYQPQIVELNDGRFLCAWHKHGDCVFGQHHQFVGQHVFRFDASRLPASTRLTLTRDMNDAQTRHINSYTAHLSAGGVGLAGKKVQFRMQKRFRDTYDMWGRPKPEPRVFRRQTDNNGKACIDLADVEPDFGSEILIHQGYEIKATFTPAGKDKLAPAESPSYYAYAVTPEKGNANNYPIYVTGDAIFAEAAVLSAYPELRALVERFSENRRFRLKDVEGSLELSSDRTKALLDYLVTQHLLRKVSSATYEWRYRVSGGVSEIEVVDDFV